MNAQKALETFQDGMILRVKHITTPNLPSRAVTFERIPVSGAAGVRVDGHLFTWDFFFEVNVLEPACQHCGSFEDVTNEYKNYMLCADCNEKYDDKTGFCPLDCCIENRCDESC